jgi:hypothetical protein
MWRGACGQRGDAGEQLQVGAYDVAQVADAPVPEVGHPESDAPDPLRQVVHRLRRAGDHAGRVPGDPLAAPATDDTSEAAAPNGRSGRVRSATRASTDSPVSFGLLFRQSSRRASYP